MEKTPPDLHVMHCIRSLDIGNQGGGAEQFAITLSRELLKKNIKVTLAVIFQIHTPAEKFWETSLREEGMQIVFINPGRKLNLWKSWRTMRRICLKEKVDILHGHYQIGNLLACLMKIQRIVPHILRTVHTPLEWGSGFVAFLARAIFTRWLFPLIMDVQVAVSQAIMEQIKRYPGSKISKRPILTIHNAIPENLILESQQLKEAPLKIGSGPKFILSSVGRITFLKGYEYLLRSLPTILEHFPELELWIIGDGPDLPRLKRLAKQLAVDQHINFLGQQNNPATHLLKSDLFILPSLVEAFPTVILESMAYGIPVIATDLPGISRIVEHEISGWLVPPKNPQLLAECIISALNSPDERRKVALNALNRIDQFSIQKIGVSYVNIYQALLENKA